MLRIAQRGTCSSSPCHLVPSSPFGLGETLVSGDTGLPVLHYLSKGSESSTMPFFDEPDGKLPTSADAATPQARTRANNDEGLLSSSRQRDLDSFVPLMSMASYEDDHAYFPDDDKHIHAPNDAPSDNSSLPAPIPMADVDDESNGFSPTICFVRQQLEFFVASEQDADARRKKGGVSGNVKAGSLGFRCIHCKHLPPSERAPSADAFPNQVGLIYQSVRNYQRHHFLKCPSVPQSLKDHYQATPRRQKSKRMVHKHKHNQNPWVYSANRKGIMDVEDEAARGGYRIGCSLSAPGLSSSLSSSTAASSLPTSPIQVKGPSRKKSRHE